MTNVTTTSTTIEDIPGLSTTVELVANGSIVAFMCADASTDTNNADGFWEVTIDGVPCTTIERRHSNSSDRGNISAVFRLALNAGTHTVKGRWRTDSGVTLTGHSICLAAFACVDGEGDTIPSIGAETFTEITTSNTLEEILTLNGNVTLNLRSHVFAAIGARTNVTGANRWGDLGISIGGQQDSHRRQHGSIDIGAMGIVQQTVSSLPSGTYKIHGLHAVQAGTLTTGAGLVGVAMEAGTTKSIESAFDQLPSDTTTSASLEDIDGLSVTITLTRTAHIFAACSLQVVNSNSANSTFSLLINNVAETSGFQRTMSGSSDIANIVLYGRTSSTLAPGTYTIKVQWATSSGTLTGTDLNLFAMALETQAPIIESSSSTSSLSSSSTSSLSSSSLSSSSTSSLSSSSTSSISSSSTSSLSTSSQTELSSSSTSSLSSSSSSSSQSSSSSSESTLGLFPDAGAAAGCGLDATSAKLDSDAASATVSGPTGATVAVPVES